MIHVEMIVAAQGVAERIHLALAENLEHGEDIGLGDEVHVDKTVAGTVPQRGSRHDDELGGGVGVLEQFFARGWGAGGGHAYQRSAMAEVADDLG